MVAETRTLQQNFNRDLLIEQLIASTLPFEALQLAGFERVDQFTGAPQERRISRIRQPDGTYVEDIAPAGELRFEVTTALTRGENTALDGLLAGHDSAQRTAEQARDIQDSSDLDTLIAQYPNVDSMNNAQLRNYVQLLARIVIRDQRTAAI